jgi:hypothetical protein
MTFGAYVMESCYQYIIISCLRVTCEDLFLSLVGALSPPIYSVQIVTTTTFIRQPSTAILHHGFRFSDG